MQNRVFSFDWTTGHTKRWIEWLKPFIGQPDIKALEIGPFEGRSTIWFLENILTDSTSRIYCIDPFEGSIEHEFETKIPKPKNYLDRFLENTIKYRNKIILHHGYSKYVLRGLFDDVKEYFFDFIYVDGNHKASAVLEDLILCHRLLKRGGVFICDDYQWNFYQEEFRMPKIAIDSFLKCFPDEYELIWRGYQICFKKL